MKITMPIFFCCLLLLFSVPQSQAQTKRALLVAVGKYPDPRWKPLSSGNDLKYLKEALQLQGFQPTDMITLVDDQATNAGIREGFEKLKQQCKQGDVVYVHFSGHGQQIQDDEENRDEVDGYDEALVAYDARGKYDPVKYQGQNHFRDDLLGKYLEGLRGALGIGGSLMVVIDACHSGTATRSSEFAVTRGDPLPFASPEYKPVLTASLGRSTKAEGFMSASPLGVSNMVVFSASSPNQVNYETRDAEGNGVGSLSYAIARALQRMGTKTSYSDLFSQVKSLIQSDYPQQLPMMEGDGNQQVFGGQYLPREQQQRVDRWLSDTSFIVTMGQLQGIYKGTVLNLLDASSRSVIGTATVGESNQVSSVGVTTKTFDKTKPYLVTVQSYGTPPVLLGIKVVPEKGSNKQQTAAIENWVKKLPGVAINNVPDFMLAVSPNGKGVSLELVEAGDAIRWQGTAAAGQQPDEANTKNMVAALQACSRSRFLRTMPDGGPYAGQIELSITASAERDASNEWKLPKGAEYKFTISNNSETRVYFNLLNILPTNEAQVLLPQPDEQPQDYSVGPGQKFEIEGIAVDEDATPGKEWLKVVCSVRPIDLRPVFAPAGSETRTRSAGGVFEQWLNESLQHTNTVRTRSAGPDAVTVVSAGFTVVNK